MMYYKSNCSKNMSLDIWIRLIKYSCFYFLLLSSKNEKIDDISSDTCKNSTCLMIKLITLNGNDDK
jgi:hypothetical protein